jgi:hypothetical protein
MDQTGQTVALWAGLFSSIVSIVLSIVAIIFSILVDRRSSRISEQTIQSLQKIESAVERLSSDTRDLIKAGWDKMLGSVDRPTPSGTEFSAKEIASGIAAELRAELAAIRPESQGAAKTAEIERVLDSVEASLAAQLRNQPSTSRPSEALDSTVTAARTLSQGAQELLRQISRVHLERDEYRKLAQGKFGDALHELRASGLLIPLQHRSEDGKPIPCYWFSPQMAAVIRNAVRFLEKSDPTLREEVREELVRVGYLSPRPEPAA